MYVCVIGGANIDIISTPTKSNKNKDSHPGTINFTLGGVGRNIAENLARLDVPVSLITALGQDSFGKQIIDYSKQNGIDMSHSLISEECNTSCYNAVLDCNGDLLYAVADMQVVEKIDPAYIALKRDFIANASICVLDTNLSEETLRTVLTTIRGPYYVLDTVSGTKAKKIAKLVEYCSVIKTNPLELQALLGTKENGNNTSSNTHTATTLQSTLSNLGRDGKALLQKGLTALVVSMGSEGIWYVEASSASSKGIHIASKAVPQVTNTTGAGDAMCAGIVYALYNRNELALAIQYGIVASILTIQDEATVATNMSATTLQSLLEVYI